MIEVKPQVKSLLEGGWELCAADVIRLEHEVVTRRMRLPRGQRTELYADRQKASRSFLGALTLTGKAVKLCSIEGNPNTEQTVLAPDRLQRETRTERIAVVRQRPLPPREGVDPRYEPGQPLERITSIYLPPYVPDLNPVEHVWNAAENNISNIRREALEEILGAFSSHVSDRALDCDFEHLPPRETEK